MHLAVEIRKDNKRHDQAMCDDCNKPVKYIKNHITTCYLRLHRSKIFCDCCQVLFNQRDSLLKHLHRQNLVEYKNSCDSCTETFLHRHNLTRHLFRCDGFQQRVRYRGFVGPDFAKRPPMARICDQCEWRGPKSSVLFEHWMRKHQEQ